MGICFNAFQCDTMSSLKNTLIKIHNLSGTFLSLMFVIWFLSGFVLIFAGFPHASREERFLHLSYLNKDDFESIQAPKGFKGRVELEKLNGNPVYRVYNGRKAQKVYDARSLQPLGKYSKEDAVRLAQDFTGAKIDSVEKIDELDQWMPWSYYRPLLPMYKCHMDDDAHTRIYVSEVSGSIVQETTRKSRWLGRIGAIPHWIYFKSLRIKVTLWSKVVTWVSALGVLVSLSGIIAGFIRLRRRNRHEKWGQLTFYKKFWHKWHHLTGFFFGLFVFAFMLSGMISVTDIPHWMIARHNKKSGKRIWNQKLELDQHAVVDFNKFWEAADNGTPIRKVAFKTVHNKPSFWVYRDQFRNPDVYIVNQDTVIAKAKYDKEEIINWCKNVMPEAVYQLEQQNEYDAYYQISGMWNRPLPVWQLNVEDKDNTRMYINAETGEVVKSITDKDRWRRWLYRSLHTFDFPYLKKHDWLRKALLLFLSLGGTVVSISGLVLGLKWIQRKSR
jgi:hypothetical protein